MLVCTQSGTWQVLFIWSMSTFEQHVVKSPHIAFGSQAVANSQLGLKCYLPIKIFQLQENQFIMTLLQDEGHIFNILLTAQVNISYHDISQEAEEHSFGQVQLGTMLISFLPLLF